MPARGIKSFSFFHTYAHPGLDLQQPFDVAVVIPSLIRPTLADALASVFKQDLAGRVQVLIGIDSPGNDVRLINRICEGRPSSCCVNVLYPGYSTSVRHGGLHPARDGGALRCVLTYLANSRYVAYLDDDNWWQKNHLSSLLKVIVGHTWAHSLRWFVHPKSRRPVCVDRWESVGPDRGFFHDYGGWVDPNCLMIDKLACEPAVALWARPRPGDKTGLTSDRNVFLHLRAMATGQATNLASVCYRIDPADDMHPYRLQWMGEAYVAAGGEAWPEVG